MQVIGFCRFSWPARGGFQVEHESLAARRAHLYAPERMAERFRIFETLALPSIAGQTDGDFRFVILVGDDLPRRHRDRLMDLVAPVPQVRVVARPPGPHRATCQEVINADRDFARPCLQFRHDDDDALALDYVATLRAVARDIRPLRAAHRRVAIDFERGWLARLDRTGIAAAPCRRPFWGVALAMAAQAGTRLSIMNFAHARLARFMPAVRFADRDMYVRGHNAFNDSRQKPHVAPVALPRLDAGGEAHFRARFNVDAAQVRRAFTPRAAPAAAAASLGRW